jgi:hypothetical protein
VLDRLKARPTINKWIKTLYSNAKFTCMVNGFHSEPVNTNRGIKQGDALSYILFILAMISFILSITKDERIKGIKCADNLRIPVLIYVNDITILLELDSDFRALLELLEAFKRASNANVNITKLVIITVSDVTIPEMGFQKL